MQPPRVENVTEQTSLMTDIRPLPLAGLGDLGHLGLDPARVHELRQAGVVAPPRSAGPWGPPPPPSSTAPTSRASPTLWAWPPTKFAANAGRDLPPEAVAAVEKATARFGDLATLDELLAPLDTLP